LRGWKLGLGIEPETSAEITLSSDRL